MSRRWLGWKYALVVIGIAVLFLLVMDFNNRMAELRRLSEKREEVAAEATSLLQTKFYLETQVAYATSDEAVYDWAYSEGRMVQEGEVLVNPLPYPGETLVPTLTVEATPTPESNWQIWFSLFFEGRPPVVNASP